MRIKIDPLDILFSRFIRTRADWTCERCLKYYHPPSSGLHCSHFHGRRKKTVRWDPENAAALCFYCHQYFTENPLEHTEWFKKRLGEKRFDALMIKANTGRPQDREMVKIWLNCEVNKNG